MVEFCYFFPFNAVGVPKVPSEVSSTRAEMQGVWKLAANRLSAAKILAFDVDIYFKQTILPQVSPPTGLLPCASGNEGRSVMLTTEAADKMNETAFGTNSSSYLSFNPIMETGGVTILSLSHGHMYTHIA